MVLHNELIFPGRWPSSISQAAPKGSPDSAPHRQRANKNIICIISPGKTSSIIYNQQAPKENTKRKTVR